jgi:hypothetical protein
MNRDIYITALAIIAAVLAFGGIADLCLYLLGAPTISEWLRVDPLWFLIPTGLMVLFLVGLAIHLFAYREEG